MLSAILLLLAIGSLTLNAQQVVNETPLEPQVITLSQTGQEMLLLRIKNVGPTASLVCVRTSSYRIGSAGRGGAMPHGCQRDASFVVVLPGESYFYRLGESSTADSKAELLVDATVVLRPPIAVDKSSDRQVGLQWEGTMQQARDGSRLLATPK